MIYSTALGSEIVNVGKLKCQNAIGAFYCWEGQNINATIDGIVLEKIEDGPYTRFSTLNISDGEKKAKIYHGGNMNYFILKVDDGLPMD